MVYKHLLGCFIPKDKSSGFLELFQVVAIVVRGDIPRLVALELRANKILEMEKDISGLHLIAINVAYLRLISHSIVLQL
jgi:hypothetical protein